MLKKGKTLKEKFLMRNKLTIKTFDKTYKKKTWRLSILLDICLVETKLSHFTYTFSKKTISSVYWAS